MQTREVSTVQCIGDFREEGGGGGGGEGAVEGGYREEGRGGGGRRSCRGRFTRRWGGEQ